MEGFGYVEARVLNGRPDPGEFVAPLELSRPARPDAKARGVATVRMRTGRPDDLV
jgi:hypothetical protein